MILEACVETKREALEAQEKGAHRIELCSRLDLDGLTPSPELIREVCHGVKIPVMVMIRPREGDFILREGEMGQMRRQIAEAKRWGARGVVFGLLTPDGKVDLKHIRELALAAAPMQVTFHKAIDSSADPVESIRLLRSVKGITRVLTSGGKATAEEGAGIIREMVAAAEGRIAIIAAGKVTEDNVGRIRELTGVRELHGRRIVGDLSDS